ncbi:MAG TPA: Lrp/AsnC family transcriptional regulator [Thermomicrobiales bacterium]|jgi:Lrp/AsnC family leucine-responsive transcriptional regulator|nr:Lrp/AsnC family transcriptional regulator [Thermomicrobiales bacterium]
MLDAADRAILSILQDDCRTPYAAIGERVGLSTSAVNERLKKLQQRGVLRRCVGIVAPRRAGIDVCAFIHVLLDRPDRDAAFIEGVQALPAVQEAHHVTGPYSYLLKVRVRDTAQLEALLARIKMLPGVSRTETQIALSSPKETMALDLMDAG